MTKKLGLAVAALCAIALAIATNTKDVGAADHLDPAGRVSLGQVSDIGDLYAWHNEGRITSVLTFAGPTANTEGTYSRDTLYTINIDGADDGFEADVQLEARFAQNDAGEWGVWVANLPGADADVVGAVEGNIESGDAMVFAGQLDDPFFFDLQGFNETFEMGTLRFDPTRDFFEGLNITALVVEFPEAALGFEGPYQIWATTADVE